MGYVESRLRSLEEQHRRLDEQIKRMQTSHLDEETIRTAKKTKLKVKEELEKLRQDATRNTR